MITRMRKNGKSLHTLTDGLESGIPVYHVFVFFLCCVEIILRLSRAVLRYAQLIVFVSVHLETKLRPTGRRADRRICAVCSNHLWSF